MPATMPARVTLPINRQSASWQTGDQEGMKGFRAPIFVCVFVIVAPCGKGD